MTKTFGGSVVGSVGCGGIGACVGTGIVRSTGFHRSILARAVARCDKRNVDLASIHTTLIGCGSEGCFHRLRFVSGRSDRDIEGARGVEARVDATTRLGIDAGHRNRGGQLLTVSAADGDDGRVADWRTSHGVGARQPHALRGVFAAGRAAGRCGHVQHSAKRKCDSSDHPSSQKGTSHVHSSAHC